MKKMAFVAKRRAMLASVANLIATWLMAVEGSALRLDQHCPEFCKCHANDIFCVGDGLSPIPATVSWNKMNLYFRNFTVQNKTLLPDQVQQSNITKILTMENIRIETVLDDAFSSLSNLQILDLDQNLLSTLNGEVFRGLGNLRELYLRNNKLTNVEDTFIYLKELTLVDLSYNCISQITIEMFNGITKYLQLVLASNKISSLGEQGLVVHARLSRIDLTGNPLTNSSIELVANNPFYVDLSRIGYQSIPFISTQMTGLSLSGNSIESLETLDTLKLSGDVGRFRDLRLDKNRIHWIQSESLLRFRNLASLYLSYNKLSSITFQLPPSLRQLYLDNNEIETVQAFALSNGFNIFSLSLNNNHINKLYPCSFCGLIELSTLDISQNVIEILPEGVFMTLDSLSTLNVRNNRIQKMESGCFIGVRKLKELDFSFINSAVEFEEDVFDDLESLNSLKMENSPHLAQIFLQSSRIFQRLTEIQYLDISYNNLSTLDSSIRTTLTRLKNIDLSMNNWICDEKLLWLSKWMNSFPYLFPFSDDLNCSYPKDLRFTPITSFNIIVHDTSSHLPVSSREDGITDRKFVTVPNVRPSVRTTTRDTKPSYVLWEKYNVPFNPMSINNEQNKIYQTSIHPARSFAIIFGYSILGVVLFVLGAVSVGCGCHMYHKRYNCIEVSERVRGILSSSGRKTLPVSYENAAEDRDQDSLVFDSW